MPKHRNIFYTAGSHGNFLKYLFDCHDAGKILAVPFNENGNSHAHSDTLGTNMCFDVCNEYSMAESIHFQTLENYSIVWQDLESFFYVMSAYSDRGAMLEKSGIKMIEEDFPRYEKTYGVPLTIGKFLKEKLNFDIDINGQPPRGVLRNYYLMSFYTYFNHVLWNKNSELQKDSNKKIKLVDILDLKSLKLCLNEIFGFVLEIDHLHQTFIEKNYPYRQLQLVKGVLDSVSRKHREKQIVGLNVISEAYILFCLDVENFDIPFHIGNDFFKSIKDIVDYVDYFPTYMKTPNKLFHLHHKHFQRK